MWTALVLILDADTARVESRVFSIDERDFINQDDRLRGGQGWTAIAGCRQFFYARYADYAITMPLIILQLGLVAGADGAMIAATIGADSKSSRAKIAALDSE